MLGAESVPPVVFVVVLLAVLIGSVYFVSRKRTILLPGAAHPAGASLVVVGGPEAGKRFWLQSDQVRIGRNGKNQIVVDAPLVSREHAMLVRENGAWRLLDQDSTNGTFVNDRRVAEHTLVANDQIRIGPMVFAYHPTGPERTPSPRPFQPPPHPQESSTPKTHRLRDYDLFYLARGGEGVVYRGVCRSDRSTVAIKVLESADPYLAQKFRQTGEMSRRLIHPHIVRSYDFRAEDGQYYIIMEYIDNGSLKDRLGGPMNPGEAARILGQVCDALDYAHSLNVVHRDVKPSNILFDRAGQVKLSDFGIAKLMTAPSFTSAGLILGTPEYMSYEQARGARVVPQSDVYSLGVVAYQLFTGYLPFNGKDMIEILDQHLKCRPVPLRQLNPAVPEAIETAVLRALNKDKAHRFSTCAEFARALGYTAPMHVGGAPDQAKPSSTSSPSVPAQNLGPAVAVTQAYLALDSGKRVPLAGGETVVGRQLLGAGMTVSREHAVIALRGDLYSLRDNGSINGTWCNGRRVFSDWVPLSGNEQLRFGSAQARFVIARSAPPQTTNANKTQTFRT